jgi:hypothetical protein
MIYSGWLLALAEASSYTDLAVIVPWLVISFLIIHWSTFHHLWFTFVLISSCTSWLTGMEQIGLCVITSVIHWAILTASTYFLIYLPSAQLMD